MSLLDTASLLLTPNAYKASKLYSIIPSNGNGDLTVTRATTATRINSSGLVESVALNVPRLDYSLGGCPSILLEPQRTNLVLRSQEFDNATWQKSGGATITANSTTAPDGTLTADTFDTNQTKLLWQTISAANNTAYTFSAWVKLGTATNLCVVANNTLSWNTIGGQSFNASNGLNTSTWTRISFTFTTPTLPVGALNIHLGGNAQSGLLQSSGTVFLWGAQLEAGAYATSYIPTTSASVTRNQDLASRTAASALIGQTEGTFFVDFNYFALISAPSVLEVVPLEIGNGTAGNRMYLSVYQGDLYIVIFTGGAIQSLTNLGTLTKGRHKVGISYIANDVRAFLDGSFITSDTSVTLPALSNIYVGSLSNAEPQSHSINAITLWKERLTNDQLAQLTTL